MLSGIQPLSAADIASAVRRGAVSARSMAEQALSSIARNNPAVNACTRVFAERALRSADAVDRQVAAGIDPGPLAGVPFVAKDLFDIEGEVTTAGALPASDALTAREDAVAVARLCAAGAVLVGSANMDEYAYGFATVNAHYGTTRNPHDLARLAGGSSGGSAAAVAAAMVPLSLGSDTNGSIRVPASLCGVFGLRGTWNAVPVAGSFPFIDRLDVVGPFTSTLDDLRLAYAVMSGSAVPDADLSGLKVARLDGWFRHGADPDALAGVDAVTAALGGGPLVTLARAAAARSAAFTITAWEGGRRHLTGLKNDLMRFDPATRDRFIAGLLAPEAAYADAETVAGLFINDVLQALSHTPILIAPATPCAAPRIDDATILMDGIAVPARANLGLYAQPLSLAGVPVLTVPLQRKSGELPLGIQLIGPRGGEGLLFAVARQLCDIGLVGVTPAAMIADAEQC